MILLAGVGVAAIFRPSWLKFMPRPASWFLPRWLKLIAGIVATVILHPLLARCASEGTTSRPRLRVGLVSAVASTIAALVLAAGVGQLGWQAYLLNFNPRFIADPLNPYVYAHTPMPLPRLAAQLDRLAERVPGGRDLAIQVVVTDNYWPLPWYLRKFPEERVGYWLDAARWKQEMDHFPPPAILMLSNDVDCTDLTARLAEYGPPLTWSLRPGVLFSVYVRQDLWPAYLACQAETPASL